MAKGRRLIAALFAGQANASHGRQQRYASATPSIKSNLESQGAMALSDSRVEKVQVSTGGGTKYPGLRSQKRATHAWQMYSRSHFDSVFPAFILAVICAAGLAMVFHASRIDSANPNPAALTLNEKATPQLLTLQEIAHLDQKTFELSLPKLYQAMENPSPKAVADSETFAAIAGKLRRAGESTPDYWPTVLRFISFASSRMAKNAPPPGQQPRLFSDILSVGIMRGVREVDKTILLDEGYLGNGEFTNCRIIFTSNPVRLTNAHFRNCVFEIPTADPPNAFIKKVSRLLLFANLSSVSIPSL